MGEHIRNGDEIYSDAGEIIGYRNPDGTNKYLVTSTSAESPLGAALAAMGDYIDIRAHGAKCDGQVAYDAVSVQVSGTTFTVASATKEFSGADVGKVCAIILRASGAQAGVDGVITAFNASTGAITVVFSNTAATKSGALFVYGTDDGNAINAAIAAANNDGTVFFPNALTCSTKAHVFPCGVHARGVANVATVDYSYDVPFIGSWVVLCKWLNTTPFFQIGNVVFSASMGSKITNMTVDAFCLSSSAVAGMGRGNEYENLSAVRGIALSLDDATNYVNSSSIRKCVLFGATRGRLLSLGSDARIIDNYIYGAGLNLPCVQIQEADVIFMGNHMWRDADSWLRGDLVKIYITGGNKLKGAIKVSHNNFDSNLGACVRVEISNNSAIRSLDISGNTSMETVMVATEESSIFTGSISNKILTVTELGFGYIYQGAIIEGTSVVAGTYIENQLTGTPGGIGTYTVSVSQTKASGSIYGYGYPYIFLDISAGSELRTVTINGNTGHGAMTDPTKGMYSSFIDVSKVLGTIGAINVSANTIDNCTIPYAAGVGGTFTPTTGVNTNALLRSSASLTPVIF